MAVVGKQSFLIPVAGQDRQIEITYFPVATTNPYEASRYSVIVNGAVLGDVIRSKYHNRAWGAVAAFPIDDSTGQSVNRIAPIFRLRRHIAYNLAKLILNSNPQLASSLGF